MFFFVCIHLFNKRSERTDQKNMHLMLMVHLGEEEE